MNVRNMPYGRTALHIAVDSGNADIARLLLLHGADANIKNDRVRNSTPLHWASSKGHVDIINLLLQVATSPTPIHSLAITLSCRRVPTSTSPPTTIEPLCTGLLTGGKRLPPLRSSTQARHTGLHGVISPPIICLIFLVQALTSMLGIKRARRLCPTPCSSSTRQWRMFYVGVVQSSACLGCHQCNNRVCDLRFLQICPRAAGRRVRVRFLLLSQLLPCVLHRV